MNERMVEYYMDMAERTAQLSRAEKLKVGAVIVTVDDCVLIGFNGTPAGFDNTCEDVLITYDSRDITDNSWIYNNSTKQYTKLKTKSDVVHAESNALMKLAKSTLSGKGASLFQTHAPCMDCAKMIYQAGIRHVHYRTDYKSDQGVRFLKTCLVDVTKID